MAAIVDAKDRRVNAPRPTVAVPKPQPVTKEEYLMDASDDDELGEQIAVAAQKQMAYRKRGEPVPIGLQIDLERLIEFRRIKSDFNFTDGRL